MGCSRTTDFSVTKVLQMHELSLQKKEKEAEKKCMNCLSHEPSYLHTVYDLNRPHPWPFPLNGKYPNCRSDIIDCWSLAAVLMEM